MTENPWRLTPPHVRAMDAFVATGCQKLAAARLGIPLRTFEARMRMVRFHMGTNSVMAALEWDRWRRSQTN